MRWAECFLILAANRCWASTGSPAYEKAFLFSLGAIWSALDWLWSSPEESLNSFVFWTLQGGGLAEGRKVSICCSFCNFNRVGKASFVTSVPVNKSTIVILLNWVWKIMRKVSKFCFVCPLSGSGNLLYSLVQSGESPIVNLSPAFSRATGRVWLAPCVT